MASAKAAPRAPSPVRIAKRPGTAPATAPAAPANRFRPFVNAAAPTPCAPSPRGAARPPASPVPSSPRPASTDSPRSSLAKAVEDRGRRFRIFPLTGFWALGGRSIERVGILYPTDRDGEAALFGAYAYLATQEKRRSAPGAAGDGDLLASTKVREILFRLCRAVDPRKPDQLAFTGDGLHAYPAFSSPSWMAQHLSPDQIAVLLRLVDEVRSEFAPRPPSGAEPWGFEDEDVDAIAVELVEAQRVGEPAGARLAHLPRNAVTRLCVRLAERLQAAQAARDALLAGARAIEVPAMPRAAEGGQATP